MFLQSYHSNCLVRVTVCRLSQVLTEHIGKPSIEAMGEVSCKFGQTTLLVCVMCSPQTLVSTLCTRL